MELIVILIFVAAFSFALVYIVYYFNKRERSLLNKIIYLKQDIYMDIASFSRNIDSISDRVRSLERMIPAEHAYNHRHDDIFRKATENFRKDPPPWGPNEITCQSQK